MNLKEKEFTTCHSLYYNRDEEVYKKDKRGVWFENKKNRKELPGSTGNATTGA